MGNGARIPDRQWPEATGDMRDGMAAYYQSQVRLTDWFAGRETETARFDFRDMLFPAANASGGRIIQLTLDPENGIADPDDRL